MASAVAAGAPARRAGMAGLSGQLDKGHGVKYIYCSQYGNQASAEMLFLLYAHKSKSADGSPIQGRGRYLRERFGAQTGAPAEKMED